MASDSKIGVTSRLAAIASAPMGAALTSLSYIWRITPIYRDEAEGSLPDDLPPPLPPGVSVDDVQRPEDGCGPLLRRTYTGVVRGIDWSAERLIKWLSEDPNRVVPLALARFKKTRGEAWEMRPGDEFQIRMPGPWDGPVRVVEVAPRSFRFATLAGHLEAGQIEWRAREEDGALVFQVESRARSGDAFSAFLHGYFPMAKEVQLHMWTSVVEHVATRTGGKLSGGVRAETRHVDADAF